MPIGIFPHQFNDRIAISEKKNFIAMWIVSMAVDSSTIDEAKKDFFRWVSIS